MKDSRKSNIEMLRVLAMLMVTMLHALGHGGVLDQYKFGTLGYVLFWTIETLCYVAVNVFVLITGYFMVTSETKISRIIKLYFQVEFYTMLCLLVAKFIFFKPIDLRDILNTLFPFTSGTYWFVSAYVILIALVPFLNKFIKSINRQQHFMAIVLLTVLFCIIPTFMFWSRDILGNGYNFIWFIVIYITAAYIRIYGDEIPKNRKAIKYTIVYLILSGGAIISRLTIGYMTETVLGVQRGTGIFYAYNTIIIFPASVCLFMAFKNMKIKNRIISNAAISIGTRCFGAYLATDNPLIRSSLWEFINLPQYGKSGISVMLIQLFFSVIVLFGMGCVIDYFRIILFRLFGINKLTLAADNCAYVIRKQISVLLERL